MKKTVTLILVMLFIFTDCMGCKPKTSTITIKSDPQDADVYINGELRGKTPLELKLPKGKYSIILEKTDFKDFTRDIEVVENNPNMEIQANLESIPSETYSINFDFLTNYAVFVDDKFTYKVTPAVVEGITKGEHTIKLFGLTFYLEKRFSIWSDKTLTEEDFVSANKTNSVNFLFRSESNFPNLKKSDLACGIVSEFPAIRSCSGDPSYSQIFVNDTKEIKGYTIEDQLFIVYPSGRKVPIKIIKGLNNDSVNRHSLVANFDEVGDYKIIDKKGEEIFHFEVYYKMTLLPQTDTVYKVFNIRQFSYANPDNVVVVPQSGEILAKFYVTDAKGNPILEKPIGTYRLNTDKFGIVTFRLSAKNGKLFIDDKEVYLRFYGALFGWVYDRAIFSSKGNLLSSTIQGLKDISIKYEGEKVYIPVSVFKNFVDNKNEFFDINALITEDFSGEKFVDVNNLSNIAGAPFSIIITDKTVEILWLDTLGFE